MYLINGCRVSSRQITQLSKLVPADRRIAKMDGHWYLVEIVKDLRLSWLNRMETVYPLAVEAMEKKGLIRPRDEHLTAEGLMYDITWEAYSYLTGQLADN